MIKIGSRRHSRAALLLRRLSTGHDHARHRAALDSRLVDRSPPRDADSAYRDRSTELPAPSTASQRGAQRTSATAASAKIPIASDAQPRHNSRGFLPWRFAYAGPGVRRATVMGPASANLHISGPLQKTLGRRPP